MLFLTLKVFSATGGIEKVNRTLTKVLNDHCLKDKNVKSDFQVLCLCDETTDLDNRYCSKSSFKGFNGNKLFFWITASFKGLRNKTIILSHIHLLSIALLIKLFRPKKRIILLAHGIEIWRNLHSWKKNFIKKHVEIWAVSAYTASVLVEKHHIPISSIVILNNCLDPFFDIPTDFKSPPYLLDRHQFKATDLVLLTVSRLSINEIDKGYDLIISAMNDLVRVKPELRYLLAGKAEKEEEQRIKKLIKDARLEDHVFLTGFIPDHELADYFQLADLFVMPSKKEGFGIVYVEAAACGCPSIAGDMDGSRDALLNGELGKLINPTSLTEIKKSILELLILYKQKNLASQIQTKSLAHFSFETYRAKVVDLLTQIK